MADILPTAFWKTETELGSFLIHNLADIQLYTNLQPGKRALILWGDGSRTRITSTGEFIGASTAHVYDSSDTSHFNDIKYTPQNKISNLTVLTQNISGLNSEFIGTLTLDKAKNLQVIQLNDIPLNDISFDNVINLIQMYLAYGSVDPQVHRLENIDLNSALSLQVLVLTNTKVETIDIVNNNKLAYLDCYSNDISSFTTNVTGNDTLYWLGVSSASTALSIDFTKLHTLANLEITKPFNYTGVDFSNCNYLTAIMLNDQVDMPLSAMITTLDPNTGYGASQAKYSIQLLNSVISDPIIDLMPIYGNVKALDLTNTTYTDFKYYENGNCALSGTQIFIVNNSAMTSTDLAKFIVTLSSDGGDNGILRMGSQVFDATVEHPNGTSGVVDVNDALNNLMVNKFWHIDSTNVTPLNTFESLSAQYNGGPLAYNPDTQQLQNFPSGSWVRQKETLYVWDIHTSGTIGSFQSSTLEVLGYAAWYPSPGGGQAGIGIRFINDYINPLNQTTWDLYQNFSIIQSGSFANNEFPTVPYDPAQQFADNQGNYVALYVGGPVI